MKDKYDISIPIQLLSKAQKERLIPELQLYVHLLINTSGTVRKGSINYRRIVDSYPKCIKTFRNNLHKLLEVKWIRYNSKSKVYHISSMNRLISQFSEYETHRVRFQKKYLKWFREYVFAAIVSERIYSIRKGIKYGEKEGNDAEQFRWSSIHHLTGAFPNFIGISVESIKSLTNLSSGRVTELKQKCTKLGLLFIRNQFLLLNLNRNQVYHFKKEFPEYSNRVRIRKGKVYLQLHDEIIPRLEVFPVSRKQAFKRINTQDLKNGKIVKLV